MTSKLHQIDCVLCTAAVVLTADGYCPKCGLCHNRTIHEMAWDRTIARLQRREPPVGVSLHDLWATSRDPIRLRFFSKARQDLLFRFHASEIETWVSETFEMQLRDATAACCEAVDRLNKIPRLTEKMIRTCPWPDIYPFDSIQSLRQWIQRQPNFRDHQKLVAVEVKRLWRQVLEKIADHRRRYECRYEFAPYDRAHAKMVRSFVASCEDSLLSKVVQECRQYVRPLAFAKARLLRSIMPADIVCFYRRNAEEFLRQQQYVTLPGDRRCDGIVAGFVASYRSIRLNFESCLVHIALEELADQGLPYVPPFGAADSDLGELPWRVKDTWTRMELLENLAYCARWYDDPFFGMRGHTQFGKLPPVHVLCPPNEEIRAQFGSPFAALVEAGVVDGLKGYYGYRTIAKDGHECNSLLERLVDDVMFEHGIPHEKEPKYPIDSDLNPSGFRADWQVGSALVELFGLLGKSAYDEKVKRKRQLVEKLGLQYLELTTESCRCPEKLVESLRSLIHAKGSNNDG